MYARDVMLTSVPTVGPDTSLREVAALVAEHRANAVVVVDGSGTPVGIVSEPILAQVLESIADRADNARIERRRPLRGSHRVSRRSLLKAPPKRSSTERPRTTVSP